MNLFKNWTLVVLSLAFAIGCTRAEKESSKMSISLPTSQASKKISSLALGTDMVLSHVVINVTGQGIAQPILYTWDICKWCPTVSPQSSFTLDVPQGTGRLIQLLAVYQSSASSEMAFYYGDSAQDISGASMDVGISISQVGQGPIISGRVSGRYLTGTDSGPTGMVDMLYSPSTSKPGLVLDRASIVNGWFSFFMLTGASFSYVVRQPDGSSITLWDGPMSLDSAQMNPDEKIVGVSGSPNFDKRVRAFVPMNLRPDYNGGNSATYIPGEPAINVWGYWGVGSTGKKVCLDGVTGSSQRLKVYNATIPATPTSFSFSHLINYDLTTPTIAQLMDTTTPLTSIVVQGGATMSAGSCAGITDTATNQFLNFQKINLQMVDSDGGDNVAGFRGIFIGTTSANNSSPTYLNVSGTDPRVLSGQVLPGVQNVINGLRLFKRIGTEDVHMEAPNCHEVAVAGTGYEGFVLGSSADATIDATGAFSLSSNISAAEASAGVSAVMCPVANGSLVPTGVFLGRWMFYSYGGGGGGGGGGGMSGPPAKVAFENSLAAITVGHCGHVNVNLLDSNNSMANATTAVTVNLSATGSGSAFYAESDYGCTGTPITSVSIPASSNWASVKFRTNATTETDITLTPTDSSATLTSVVSTVRARSMSSVAQLSFNTTSQSANVGTCLSMSLKATQTDGTLVSYTGPVNLTAFGASIYTDPACTMAFTNPVNLAAGVGNFYVKSAAPGWASLEASATIDGLNFKNYYGISIVPSGQPTHLTMSSPSAEYLFVNQCMPITVTSQDDSNTAAPSPVDAPISFMATSSGSFYTDPNCLTVMSGSGTNFAIGQSAITVYFKPQNSGSMNVSASTNGNGFSLWGNQSYNIGSLWLHTIHNGFNASWYDSACRSVTFQLMDGDTAGSANIVPNRSGSAIGIDMSTNGSLGDGGLYNASDCSDSIGTTKSVSIAANASTANLYMRSLRASGNYLSVAPNYTYSSVYQPGNTITSLSFAWCPPMDGGGACPSSLSFTGAGVGGGVVGFGTVTTSTSVDVTVTMINNDATYSINSLSTSISGTNSSEYVFKGGTYPGTGGNCGPSLAPGASCTMVLTFTPSDISGRYAYLNLTYSSNYNASAQNSLSLQGTGQ